MVPWWELENGAPSGRKQLKCAPRGDRGRQISLVPLLPAGCLCENCTPVAGSPVCKGPVVEVGAFECETTPLGGNLELTWEPDKPVFESWLCQLLALLPPV